MALSQTKGVQDLLPVAEGSNQLEIVDFRIQVNIGGRRQEELYGINVSKTIELLYCPEKITAVPSGKNNPAQLGLVLIRDQTIPVFDMGRFIGLDVAFPIHGPVFEDEKGRKLRSTLVVTEFSHLKLGFLVHSVARIRRFSWNEVKPVAGLVEGAADERRIVGVVMVPAEDSPQEKAQPSKILQIIDLEAVANQAGFFSHQAEETELMAQESPKNKTILLADDSSSVRKAVTKSLEKAGYTVIQAETGKRAWDIVAQGTPVDLVISDIEMPEMDGYTLIAKIRDNPATAKVPILINSSMSGSANKKKGLDVGATDYLVKLDPKELIQTVEKYV